MRNVRIVVIALALSASGAIPALAQRFTFDRSYDVSGGSILDRRL